MMLEYLKFIPSLDSIDIPYLWNKDDIKYHNSVNLRPLIVQGNQENFYNKFIETLKSSDYKKEAEYLLKNIFVNSNQYTLAFAFAQTHSFSYPYHVYMKVVNRTNFSPEEIEINEGHLNYTSSALLPCLDIPNHIFPNKLNKTNLNSFKLIPKKGSIGMVIKSVIKRNEEYGFAYTPDMDSNHMLQAYGFTILNNPGELIFLQVDNIMKNFSISCLQLCVELGCIQEDSVSSAYYSFPKNDNLKEPKNLVFTLAKYELYNADLLMLCRFNKLTATQCNSSNSIKDNLRIYGYVNLYNEVYGLIELIDTLAKFLFIKTSISKDEEELSKLLNSSSDKSQSKSTSRRIMSITSALSQKSVVLAHANNLFERLNKLTYFQVENEIESLAYINI